MITRALILLVLATATVSALTEDKVNQQFDVTPGGKIIVDVDFGTIDVAAGADDKVAIDAHREIDSDDATKEKEYLTAAPILVIKDGNSVIIRSKLQEKDRDLHWSGHGKMDARYVVRVPHQFDSDLRTGGGSIVGAELTGTMSADTSGGKLKFTHLRGSISATTSGGSIELNGCEGPLNVVTSGGHIEATDGSGSLEARTSGGSIVIKNFGGDTEVETSGGRLALENINGKIVGRTSGGSIIAQLRSPVPGDVHLRTSAGSIEVSVPPDAGLDVEAETNIGRVTSELPVSGTRDDHEQLKGKINGGGKALVLHSSAGSISIKPTSTETAKR